MTAEDQPEDHPSAPGGPEGVVDAAEVQAEIEQLREQIGEIDRWSMTGEIYQGKWLIPTILVGIVTVFAVFATVYVWVLAVGHGAYVFPTVLTVPTLGLLALEAFLFRKAMLPYWVRMGERRRAAKRITHLKRVLAGEAVDAQGQPVRVRGETVPMSRQPTVLAQAFWRRFPFLGPSPEKMLRTLPEGTAKPRLWFHRYVGWGAVFWILLAVVVLSIVFSI